MEFHSLQEEVFLDWHRCLTHPSSSIREREVGQWQPENISFKPCFQFLNQKLNFCRTKKIYFLIKELLVEFWKNKIYHNIWTKTVRLNRLVTVCRFCFYVYLKWIWPKCGQGPHASLQTFFVALFVVIIFSIIWHFNTYFKKLLDIIRGHSNNIWKFFPQFF